jgi:hypothetical protein
MQDLNQIKQIQKLNQQRTLHKNPDHVFKSTGEPIRLGDNRIPVWLFDD